MQGLKWQAAAIAVLVASPSWAGDKVLTGPVPSWVAPAPPLGTSAISRKDNTVPLFDEQMLVDGDKVTSFIDTAAVISSPEALARAGTLSINWKPNHGDLTFHRIEILRGGQIIDALQGGAGITVLRREAGLERLVVDGALTAVKHIEGLQVGDTLRTTVSVTERDSVLAGHVQSAMLLLPAPTQVTFGRARLVWPSSRPIAWKTLMPGIAVVPKKIDQNLSELIVPLPVGKLQEMPKNMPSRFQPLPVVQFSSFPDWSTVAKVMAPLYSVKGTLEPGSELAARVDAIAARSVDPLQRLADALRMVQDEVRYQLVALDTGNYVPQAPADTWTKRYGDCKAKTMLLLAILDRLGIEAEPIAANSKRGDGVPEMLPSAMAFDHVFVRARVGDEDFWVDGTMLGSRLADIRNVPRYGYVLPLFSKNAALVELPRRANARPDLDIDVAYNMTSGPHLPTPFNLTLRYAGPYAAEKMLQQSADYDEKLTDFAENAAKSWTGSTTIGKPRAEYDPEQAIWTLTVDGIAYPDWEYHDGHFGLPVKPNLIVNYDAPRDRSNWRTIPAVIEAPWTAESRVAIDLPDGAKGATLSGGEVTDVALPAVEWRRTVRMDGTKLIEDIVSRESGMEIPPDKVSMTSKEIREATSKVARVELATTYPQRWDDVGRMRNTSAMAKARALFDERIAAKPDDASRVADRAWLKERLFDWAGAEADYDKAIALDESAARYLDRSNLRSKRGNHPGALQDAQTAYGLDEGSKDVRDQLVTELAEAGKVDEALDLLPSDPDVTTDDGLSALLQRTYVLEIGGRHSEALELLDGAVEKRGSSAELRNARCWYQGLRGVNLEAALADCNRAIELASNPAGYLDSRAMVHFRAGNLTQARADYDAALTLAPEQASSLFVGGMVSERLGDKGRAAATQRAARTILPDIERFYSHFGIKP